MTDVERKEAFIPLQVEICPSASESERIEYLRNYYVNRLIEGGEGYRTSFDEDVLSSLDQLAEKYKGE